MLSKIKSYWLAISGVVVLVLVALLKNKSGALRSLQARIAFDKDNLRAQELEAKVKAGSERLVALEKERREALKRMREGKK